MRACVQCGLSIGESATFCPVCGARTAEDGAVATAVATRAPLEAVVAPAGPSPDPEYAGDLEAAPVTGHGAIPNVEPETEAAELVANLAAEHAAGTAAALEPESTAADEATLTVGLEEGTAVAPELESATAEAVAEPLDEAVAEPLDDADAGPTAEPAPEVADEPASEAAAGPESVEAADAAQPDESIELPQDGQDRKMAEIADLLELGSRCEGTDPARAALVYSEVVLGCLEATDDPLRSESVRRSLLRGFDRLSFVLGRQGLPEEALAVIDEAASLGLLDGADAESSAPRDSLVGRRESLRRSLRGDSARA